MSFKQFLLNGGTFQQIGDDPARRQALEQDKRLHNLLKGYISFFELENRLSNLFFYLKEHIEIYSRLMREKQEAEQMQKEWVVLEYDRRIDNTKYRLQKTHASLKDTVAKIVKTEFFQMLKLMEKRKHFIDSQGGILSEEEQKKRALIQLRGEEAFSYSDVANVFADIGIQLGSDLELYLKQN